MSGTEKLEQPDAPRRAGIVALKLAIVLLLTSVMVVLILRHTPRVNGPIYWTWSWRRLPALRLYGTMALAFVPFVVAHVMRDRGRIGRRAAIGLVMLSTLALQLAAIAAQPPGGMGGLKRLAMIVQNSVNTSYYNAADVLVKEMQAGASYRDWMEIYPQLMEMLMLHAGYKPPGLILYYIGMINLFGAGDGAALAGGLLIALLATAGVGATYALIRYFGGDEPAAFCGASFFALCPSLILFLPQFDQVYPALGCLLLITWAAALRPGGRPYAFAFGALLALLLFATSMFLMLGVFLAVYTLLHVSDSGAAGLKRAIERSLIVLVTIVVLYLLLHAATGFDMIATFNMSTARAESIIVDLGRPWPLHSAWDVYDVGLGTGWISYPLAAAGAFAAWRSGGGWRSPMGRLVFLGLLQITMALAVSIFPGENARLMLWAMPMLMAPIGLELSRNWPPAARLSVYVCLWLSTVVICQNMTFLYMGPELDGPRS
ncbi:MAG: hypothetical protein WBD40_17500 [Tepidisphaeraceae bacterium]